MVDGEVGRFEFTTHSVIDNHIKYETAKDLFTQLTTNKYYRTVGFKEISMIYGGTENSYRKTTRLINRIRYQQKNGTPYRTLQENIEKEGIQLNEHIAEKSKKILSSNEFTEDGAFQGDNDCYKIDSPIAMPFETVKKAAQDLQVGYDISEMGKVVYEQ